ncbi:hypothetical protein RvVAT039_37040 [Agrobacterium vitis]|nr:hypothetical protein RvVAT039_37040 [Agrobacterium vitis]
MPKMGENIDFADADIECHQHLLQGGLVQEVKMPKPHGNRDGTAVFPREILFPLTNKVRK